MSQTTSRNVPERGDANPAAQSERETSIAGLIGAVIATADGHRLGHVVDVELTPAPEYRVLALLYGRAAWLYRFHALHGSAALLGRRPRFRRIPWEAVASAARDRITLKAGAEPQAE
jgi:sporulation protein YlmC with PRC-barrel domain